MLWAKCQCSRAIHASWGYSWLKLTTSCKCNDMITGHNLLLGISLQYNALFGFRTNQDGWDGWDGHGISNIQTSSAVEFLKTTADVRHRSHALWLKKYTQSLPCRPPRVPLLEAPYQPGRPPSWWREWIRTPTTPSRFDRTCQLSPRCTTRP